MARCPWPSSYATTNHPVSIFTSPLFYYMAYITAQAVRGLASYLIVLGA